VKLYLTLLFIARPRGWAADRKPAAAWAWLLGLEDPEKAGAQRVSKAIRAMAEAGDIQAEQRQGREPSLSPCIETGKNVPWFSPVGVQGKKQADENLHWQLDRSFWQNGWITVLSARAVAALVVLLDATWEFDMDKGESTTLESGVEYRPAMSLRWYHISETQLKDRYALSRDLFDRGVKELISWSLVEAKMRPSRTPGGARQWSTARFYRELRVRLEVLRQPVADIAEGRIPARVQHSSEPVVIHGTTGKRLALPPPEKKAARTRK